MKVNLLNQNFRPLLKLNQNGFIASTYDRHAMPGILHSSITNSLQNITKVNITSQYTEYTVTINKKPSCC